MEDSIVRQVVTEHDMWIAMYDYMAEQLDGRCRLQFPGSKEVIDHILDDLNNPIIRADLDYMENSLGRTTGTLGTILSACMLTGCCQNDPFHEFMRDFLNLVWDARWLTTEWLKSNGIPVGQSVN